MKLLLKVGCRCGQARPFPAMKLQDRKTLQYSIFTQEYQLMNKRQPPGRFGPMLGLGNRRKRPIGEAELLCSNL